MSPRKLSELRIGYIGGDRLAGALRSVCEVDALEPEAWRQGLADRAVHLLLVEGRGPLPPEWRGELAGVLAACGRLEVPRMLWATGDPLDGRYLALADDFDRAFASGVRGLLAALEAGFRDPSLLWNATALPVDDRAAVETAARPDPIVWIGGWRDDWPDARRARLEEVLRAASSRGLRILGLSDPAALPERLRQYARPTELPRQAALERARLVLAADPNDFADDVVPGVLFDAIACGAAPISPTPVGNSWDFCRGGDLGGAPPEDLIPAVDSRETAAAEIDRLLDDSILREDIVHRCRRIVAYNHTHAHRAATLASAAGLRLIPDATPSPAHR